MTASHDEFQLRLEGIQTQWSLVRQAGESGVTHGIDARKTLALRYASAIRSYLGAILRDDEATEEVAQQAMVKIMQGDFGGADPTRGRFRDLLKTALRNMARNYWRTRKRNRAAPMETEPAAEDSRDDPVWNETFSRNVLDLTWAPLENDQLSQPGSIAYTVLRTRTEFPDATSDELAQRLSQNLGREVTAATFRQQLRRSRLRFAELLVREIADGLENPTPARIQDELITLGLFEYVRDLLPAEWNRSGRDEE